MNDSMSLGIHRLWKDSFVSHLLPRLPPSHHQNVSRPSSSNPAATTAAPFRCLDVAGGTGDIALRLLDRAREKYGNREIEVEVVDLNEGMLNEGRKRVAKTIYYNSVYMAMRQNMRANNTSTTNIFHPRKRSASPFPHRGQLYRSVHDRVRNQELQQHPRSP